MDTAHVARGMNHFERLEGCNIVWDILHFARVSLKTIVMTQHTLTESSQDVRTRKENAAVWVCAIICLAEIPQRPNSGIFLVIPIGLAGHTSFVFGG